MTTEIVKQKLKLILEDPKYATNVAKLSTRFRDQKEKPVDRAIWWVEWVLRNPNAVEFLKSPVLRFGLIVGNFYDVVFIISIVILLTLFGVGKCLLFHLRSKKSKSNSNKKREKNEWKKQLHWKICSVFYQYFINKCGKIWISLCITIFDILFS